jgi:hypothetical protein
VLRLRMNRAVAEGIAVCCAPDFFLLFSYYLHSRKNASTGYVPAKVVHV